MKNKIVTVALVLLGFSSDADDGWEQQSSGTTENLNAITFTSTSVGYAVGNNGVGLKTSDGSTWSAMSMSTTENIKSIFFTDANNGFATDQGGNLLTTTSAGSSWTKKNIQAEGINGVAVNGNNGVLAGDNGFIYHSTDGGSQWTSLGTQSVFSLNDVCFLNEDMAVVVGSGGIVLKTTNGGSSWTNVSIGTSVALSSVSAYNDSSLIVSGTNGTLILFNLYNGDYEALGQGLSTSWMTGVDCWNQSCKSVGSLSSVLVANGEEEWMHRPLDETANLNDVALAAEYEVYAVGIGGVIYHSALGGYKVETKNITKKLISIFPNPFESQINIKCEEPSLLEIYTANGQLIHQEYNWTTGSINLNGAIGTLFLVKVSDSKGVFTQKVVKQ